MAKQTVNLGTTPSGAGGDTFRSGSAKLQANDNEIYSYLGDGTNLNKLGTAAFKNIGANSGDVLSVGAFGLGVYSPPLLTVSESENPRPTSLSIFPVGSAFPTTQVQTLSYGQDYSVQFCFANVGGNPILRSRRYALGVWSSIATYYCDKNTTVDSNGFIKKASPIVQLFSDKIELNEEAKQQDIAFEKLGVGDYLIKGSSGFAQSGWYVETPKDSNGNVLFSVIYETLENGDISVKTYKKKFDIETASIVADLNNPIDITENRWIDLRLQELPQPEIEELESITPPDFQPTGLAQAVATVMESYNGTEQ